MTSKKAFPLSCFLFAAAFLYGYDQAPLFPFSGSFPAPAELSELALIHDGSGTVYVLSIAEGEAGIVRKRGDGDFEPFHPAGFPGGIKDPRRLQLSASGPVQYAAFIGSRGGTEELHVFGLNDAAELVYYPLPRGINPAPISRYALTVSGDGGAAAFVLAGGTLRLISGIGLGETLSAAGEISSPGDPVEDFDIAGDSRRRYVSGWYSFSRAGKKEITLFLCRENSLPLRKPLGPRDETAQAGNGMAITGETTLAVISGNQVELYQNSEGGISLEASFAAPLGVIRYIGAAETGGDRGLLVCEGEDEGRIVVYGVVHEKSAAPQFPAYLSLEEGFIAEALYAGEGRLFLVYREKRSWNSAEIDISRGLVKTVSLPGAGDYRGSCFPGGGGLPLLCFTRGEDGEILELYSPRENAAPGPVKTLALPPEFPGQASGSNEPASALPGALPGAMPGLTGRFIYPAGESALVLGDPETERFQILRGKPRAWSRRINGVLYFAGYDDAGVSLYRQEE